MADLAPPHASRTREEATLVRKPWWFLLGLLLSVMVSGLSSVCIKQLLLPIQVSQLAPHNTAFAFTLVASCGAAAGLIASPLMGALSDRTSSRYGRRRPFLLLGIVVALVGMVLMAFARALPQLLVGELLAQVGVDTLLAVSTAVIPDQVPISQRALFSAIVGLAPNVGGVMGLWLVSRFTDTRDIRQGYLLMSAVSLLCVLAFLLILRDRAVAEEERPPAVSLGAFLRDFLRPLGQRDFALTLASRCCAYLAFTILGAYLLFSLLGRFQEGTAQAATAAATFQLLSTAVLLLFALLAGWRSKRQERLKPLVIVGAVIMALGLALLAITTTWTGLWTAAVVFGCGFGLYLGADIQLAIRVLPSASARAKDLGLMYNAIYLSLLLSPLIGGAVLTLWPGNFALLFGLAALASLLSAVLIVPIKGVR